MAAAYVVEFQGCALVHCDDCDCDANDIMESCSVVNKPINGHYIRRQFVTSHAADHLDNFGTTAATDKLRVDWYRNPVYWWKPMRVVSVTPEDPDYLPFVEEHIATLNASAEKAGLYTISGRKVYLCE